MASLSSLASILGLSVVSGVNLYLAVLAVGLAHRLQWITGLPAGLHVLGHPVVLGVAGLLFLLEVFADKIPFVTLVWDAVHTFVRPLGGFLLALGAAADLHPMLQTLAGLAGGSIALGTHGTKMGVRILAHSAPEPGTHSLISILEDLGVLGLLALVYAHPAIALPILGGLLLAVALTLPLALRVVRFLLAGLLGRLQAWFTAGGPPPVPAWADLALLERDPQDRPLVLRAFARRMKGVPRLKAGCLAWTRTGWCFLYRRRFRTRILLMDPSQDAPLRVTRGLLWDTLVFLRDGRAQILYLPKDVAGVLHAAIEGPSAAES